MISFRKVLKHNFWKVASLNDGSNTEKYIDYSHNILLHALFYKSIDNIRAIYNNKELVGLVYFYQINKNIWINSFMIDHKYQNKGYGKQSFSKLLDYIKKNYTYNRIELATSNPIAMNLYQNFGFNLLNNKRSKNYFEKHKENIMTLKNN